MKVKPLSILYTIAEHYHFDALDFASRFDILWEEQTHKSGRIKSFVDLLMGCECALKSHIALGRMSEDPKTVYSLIRKAKHQIAPLAQAACYLKDRSHYDTLTQQLQDFSVFIRYSLDAYESFFPFYVDSHESKVNYNQSIGNNSWVLEVRTTLDILVNSSNDAFSGFVTNDFAAIVEAENQMKEFMRVLNKR